MEITRRVEIYYSPVGVPKKKKKKKKKIPLNCRWV